jgi:replicative DNA helicase
MKNFDTLPEQDIDIQGKPKKTKGFLDEYYNGLGDGTLELIGIKTDFERLNKATLGLDGLIVLGGLPGAGKTSFALQLAFEASNCNIPTLFYSLEMPRRAIFTKILNRLAKVRYSDILLKGRRYLSDIPQDEETGYKLSTDDANRLTSNKNAFEAIAENFYIRTRERNEADINFETVEQEINHIKAQHKTERVFVVIDHLQIFDAGNYKDQIDKEGKLIKGFTDMSRKTGATIVLISQKSKAGFASKGLEAIKGSVDIVYQADVVMFLESEDETKDKEENIIIPYGPEPIKKVTLIIAKNRYNAPTKIKMDFNGEYSEFTESRHTR